MSKGARKSETDAIAWNGYIIPVDQKAQYYLEVILVHWIHQRASGWIECRWITVLEIGINYLWEKIGRLFWKMFKCHCCSNRIPLYATMCVVCEFLLCITKWPYFHHNCHSLTCCIFYFDFFFVLVNILVAHLSVVCSTIESVCFNNNKNASQFNWHEICWIFIGKKWPNIRLCK